MSGMSKIIEKNLPKILNHFKKHWWKWLLMIVTSGLAFSGYSCKIGETELKKSAPLRKQEQVKNVY